VVERAITSAASFQSRRAAVTGLGRLAEGTGLAPSRNVSGWRPVSATRTSACAWMAALGPCGDRRCAFPFPPSRGHAPQSFDGRTKRRFRNAVTQLREKGSSGEKLRQAQRGRRTHARGGHAGLRERLEALEARPSSAVPPTPPASAATQPNALARWPSHRPQDRRPPTTLSIRDLQTTLSRRARVSH